MTRASNQYYYAKENGMKLRSGKNINCINTTRFYTDTEYFVKLMSKKTIKKIPKIFNNIMREGFNDGSDCMKALTFIKYLNLYRSKINIISYKYDNPLTFRDSIVEKLKSMIDIFENKSKPLEVPREGDSPEHSFRSGYLTHKTMCGCKDFKRHCIEQFILLSYLKKGPGRFHTSEFHDRYVLFWTPDETLHNEGFKENLDIYVTSWRHDLTDIVSELKRHLSYFQRVPHKIHQDAYFLLSSRNQFSSYIPQDCAKHIISFL